MISNSEFAFEFEPFRLFPSQQLLMEGPKVCPVGSRSLAILICLLERAGTMVTKQELLERVWPGALVDDANLRVNLSGLRKALGDGQGGRRFIVNLTGQGYSFVAPVRRVDVTTPERPPARPSEANHNLPVRLAPLLGREPDIQAIALQMPMRRCVTLAGPGGIGKTTVATAVAERLLPVYDDGVWFVDLSAVADGHMILPSIAQVLGISLQSGGALASLLSYLRDKRLLLLLDNCEHVIDDSAILAERILQDTHHVSVLATSRETLRVSGEWVHWLAPLAVPPVGSSLTAVDALSFAAVRLFVDCAARSIEAFSLEDVDVPLAVAVCRGLDGLPLAIELAAARIDMLGLAGLAKVLDEPFLLLSEGRRGAFPRQQSLLRMLEWSYRLLSPTERTILRRLSVFRGEFSIGGALQIAAGDGIEPEDVYSAVFTLSAKSLIASNAPGGSSQHHHRMLHVTRTLLSHKLKETTENSAVLRRHANFLQVLLTKAETDWDGMTRAAWLDLYGQSIVDVRAAIAWAFSPEGDASLGVALTAAALPLGFQLSLIEEFRSRVERALLHCQRIRPPQLLSEMRLNIALGMLTHNTKGPMGGRSPAIERAVDVGRRLDRPAYRVEPLLALATAHLGGGDYRLAIDVATQTMAVARDTNEPMAVLAAERILAQAHHFDGDHTVAEGYARRVIDHPVAHLPLAYNLTPVDRRVSMQIILARIHWVRGQVDLAEDVLRATMIIARKDGAFTLCPTLAFGAIPIALWSGDEVRAESLNALLNEQATRYTLGYWLRWSEAFEVALRMRAGGPEGAPHLSDSLQFETFATLSPHFLTPEVASREANEASGWCSGEIRRAQGEWLISQQAPGSGTEAETLFMESLNISRKQGALSWELRAASSLARLLRAEGRLSAARDLLGDVLGRFASPQRTVDFKQARALLGEVDGDERVTRATRERPARRRIPTRNAAPRRRY